MVAPHRTRPAVPIAAVCPFNDPRSAFPRAPRRRTPHMKHAFLHALLPSFAVLLLLPLCAAAKPRLAFTPEPAAMTTPAAKPAASAPAQTTSKPAPPLPKAESDALLAEAMRRGMNAGGLLLIVDVPSQTAYLYSARTFLRSFAVSTSKYGVGSQSGSQKTPLGWHRVEERYGAKAAPGTVFVSRRPDGRILRPEQWSDPAPAEDLVLTRILWLRGLEPGQNAGRAIDSHERCIYLHGTNQEQLLGTPASHGCIRFSNEDMIQLFSLSDGVSLYCYIR